MARTTAMITMPMTTLTPALCSRLAYSHRDVLQSSHIDGVSSRLLRRFHVRLHICLIKTHLFEGLAWWKLNQLLIYALYVEA